MFEDSCVKISASETNSCGSLNFLKSGTLPQKRGLNFTISAQLLCIANHRHSKITVRFFKEPFFEQKEFSKRSGNLINRKNTIFYIETIPNFYSQLQKKYLRNFIMPKK